MYGSIHADKSKNKIVRSGQYRVQLGKSQSKIIDLPNWAQIITPESKKFLSELHF